MIWRGCGCGCLVVLLLGLSLLAIVLYRLSQVPKTYPPVGKPLTAPSPSRKLGGGLEGFDSPYLGHTGSWDGKGGRWGGGSKVQDLEVERSMGLRWTFMPVYWRVMEPDGPVDLSRETPPAWQALDAFVIAAQQRGLNILMQAPVVGGNAGGPPDWAGRRQPGKSACTVGVQRGHEEPAGRCVLSGTGPALREIDRPPRLASFEDVPLSNCCCLAS